MVKREVEVREYCDGRRRSGGKGILGGGEEEVREYCDVRRSVGKIVLEWEEEKWR